MTEDAVSTITNQVAPLSVFQEWGFDYISPPIPVAVLHENQATFVCRYLSNHETLNGVDKDISKAELDELLAGGIDVVLNWETSGQMPGEAQGVQDAKLAQAELETLGQPKAVVYFSADFNPSGQETQIADYMRGVCSVLGVERAGIYGGIGAIQAAFSAGVASYGWQTFAWSNGVWDARAQIQQYQNNVTINGRSVDRDRTITKEFGQVQPETTPAPKVLVGYVVYIQEGYTANASDVASKEVKSVDDGKTWTAA